MKEPRPFRGSEVRGDRAWTRTELRGRSVLRLFRGVYVSSLVDVTLVTRARAALLVHPTGVVGGVAAGAVWGSAYGAVDAEVDVCVTTRGARSQPGLRAHRDALRGDEIAEVDGVRVTTPARTAFDLARRLPVVEAVAAVEALCRVTALLPGDVARCADHHPGARGIRGVARVLGLIDVRSSSPAWSRARLALVLRGVPPLSVGFCVAGADGSPVVVLELAWPSEHYGLRPALLGPPVPRPDLGAWRVEHVDPRAAVERAEAFATGVLLVLRGARRPRC